MEVNIHWIKLNVKAVCPKDNECIFSIWEGKILIATVSYVMSSLHEHIYKEDLHIQKQLKPYKEKSIISIWIIPILSSCLAEQFWKIYQKQHHEMQ